MLWYGMLALGGNIPWLTLSLSPSTKSNKSQMVRLLSRTFRSIKNPNPNRIPTSEIPPKSSSLSSSSCQSKPSPSKLSRSRSSSSSNSRPWCVYLILSTNNPIKTYVGVTNNFDRRLRQHNGEIKGGAKASRAGRPWLCACIIQGFKDKSEACAFEFKWKSISRELPRKRVNSDTTRQVDDSSFLLLQHRQAALRRVEAELVCSHLEINWQLNLD